MLARRTTSSLVAATLLGGGLVLAAPVAAPLLVGSTGSPKIVRLVVQPHRLHLARNTSGSFRVVAKLSNGTSKDVTHVVRWKSSRHRQAAPDAAGSVGARRAGRTKLVARLAGISSRPG